MKFVTNLTSFKAGILSKKLHGRTDIREHPEGLSIGKNAFIAKQGGAYKRAGLHSVTQLPDNQENVQIEVIELGEDKSAYMVFTPTVTYPTLNTAQWRLYDSKGNALTDYFDIFGIVGKFTVVTYEEYFVIINQLGTSFPTYVGFSVNDVGKIEISNISFLEDSPYSFPQGKVNTDSSKRIRLKNINAVGGANQMESTGFQLQDEFVVGDWVMVTGIVQIGPALRISTGMYKITSFVSSSLANVAAFFWYQAGTPLDSMANVLVSVDANGVVNGYGAWGTDSNYFDEWSHSLWTGSRGKPKHVAVDEGRLVFANAKGKPTSIWGSRTNNPFFFLSRRFTSTDALIAHRGSTTTYNPTLPYSGDILETDPYFFTLSTKKSSEITFMESASNFIVGTNKQEFIISGNNGALSQKNFTARPHTSHGSASGLSLVFDNTVLFAGRSRQQVYMFRYSQENGSFVSKEVTILNPDLFENERIKTMEWHEELGICFIVTDSGKLYTLALNTETGTAGFTIHEFDGTVLDCAYGIRDNGDSYMAIIVQRDGGIYVDKITEESIDTVGFDEIEDKLRHLDNFRSFDTLTSLSTLPEDSITFLDTTNDYFNYNYSTLKIGDTVRFNSSDVNAFDDINLSLGQTYYIIPYKDDDRIGFRLADSLANAQSNTYIDIVGLVPITLFNDSLVFPSITRVNQTIPTEQFDVGAEVTVFARQGSGDPVEISFTADGSATYDLGALYTNVAYGQTYSFHIATVPIEAGQQWGSAQLGLKRVDKAGIRVYDTRSFKLSTDGYNSEEVILDDGEMYTGTHQMEVTGNPEYEHVIHIQNDKAEGCFIASLALRGLSNDG